jgi:hypothetical protein
MLSCCLEVLFLQSVDCFAFVLLSLLFLPGMDRRKPTHLALAASWNNKAHGASMQAQSFPSLEARRLQLKELKMKTRIPIKEFDHV